MDYKEPNYEAFRVRKRTRNRLKSKRKRGTMEVRKKKGVYDRPR